VRLLIVSWYFPPVNTIGAVRVGKFARFLIERGHDVGVVAGSKWGAPETLPLGVPLARVIHAKPRDINAGPQWIERRLKRASPPTTAPPRAFTSGSLEGHPEIRRRSALRRLSDLYVMITNIPDSRIGWLPAAYAACRSMCRDWRPDLIFASGPPFTAFLAAFGISKRLGVPWIAELRDRWADDPYDDSPRWRHVLDEGLERRILRTASGLVTVTEPWAEFYRLKYKAPVATIYNGFDPRDFEGLAPRASESPHLVIAYTGSIYPGRRDPSPLFRALHRLGPTGERVRVVFCGTDPAHVFPLAEQAAVRHLVEVRPPVSYRQSLEFQQQADVLLLMQWNDPREQGNCPGKFFEYLGSLRPVLVLGLKDGVPATIVRQRAAGFCANDPHLIADQLKVWLQEKQQFGRVRALPEAAREGLSRDLQFASLEDFLTRMVR
jgi:glycosyltransferase involved in cell wall biosynthesis